MTGGETIKPTLTSPDLRFWLEKLGYTYPIRTRIETIDRDTTIIWLNP